MIPVKVEYRNQFGGIVHDQSSTGQTLYIEPQAILDLNNHLRQLAAQEKAEIERILYELSMEIEPFTQELYGNSEVLNNSGFHQCKSALCRFPEGDTPDHQQRESYRHLESQTPAHRSEGRCRE